MDGDKDLNPSYWLDACEDIDLGEFVQPDSAAASVVVPSDVDPSFFDGVLDSIPAGVTLVEAQPVVMPVSNGVKRGHGEANKSNEAEVGNRERFGKRVRVERERVCRKRGRDSRDCDVRDKGFTRRREQHCNGGRGNRDADWRDGRGYWERDRLGTNDMVFHPGSWESSGNQDVKAHVEKNNGGNEGELKKDDPKKKVAREHVRKYQLDVLEQAKNKNTIAFLETGAGKTLIQNSLPNYLL